GGQHLAVGDGPMIAVEGLTKVYGGRTALDHVSFEVPKGEIFGFVGPNGAGKTTTLRILAALLEPTAGPGVGDGAEVAAQPRLEDPASGLDPRALVEMREILKELQTMGKTIIISSHILPELTELCTMIGIIDQGRMRATGPVQEVIRQLTTGRRLRITVLGQKEEAAAVLKPLAMIHAVTTGNGALEAESEADA